MSKTSEPKSPWPPNWEAIDFAISVLNWSLRQSPTEFQRLMESWVQASPEWVHSDNLQCYEDDTSDGPTPAIAFSRLRVLGLINGLFGVAPSGWGYIAAVYSDDGQELLSFRRTDPKHLGLNADYSVPVSPTQSDVLSSDDPARGGQ